MSDKKIDPRLGRMERLIYEMSVAEQASLLKKIWLEKMGYELDLEHPKTFNEKLQWYKLYYHHPDMPRCVDKVTFKDYIAEKLGEGYTAKMLRVWHSPDEVCFDGLPDRFVVKSNCQDNGRYIAIVRDKENFDFCSLEREIKDYWFEPMNLLINGFCSAYHSVKPKVFVEEYVEQPALTPDDFKLLCFSGTPKFFSVATEHFFEPVNYPIGYYTLDWHWFEVQSGQHQIYKNALKPKHLDEMIDIAKTLSAGFPFVRVDFFDTNEKLYLAELTFYPGGGFAKYAPPEFDAYMGSIFQIGNI